jgi:hypothetical protein
MRALLAVLVVFAACDEAVVTPPAVAHVEAPPPREVTAQLALPLPQLDLPKQLAFDVLDAGSGARAPLRYAFAPGAAEYPVVTRLSSRAFIDGAWSEIAPQPAVKDGFAITVGDKLLALRALPGDASPVWAQLLGGRRMTIAVDDRGELGELRFADGSHSDDAHDEAMQRLIGTIVPLPPTAVGVGASWRVTTALRQSGVIVKQTATYTLIGPWKVHAVIRRDAAPQRVSADAELVAIFRVLEGDLTLSPARPLGTGSLAIESRVHARVGSPAVDQLTEDTGTLDLR